MAKTLKDADKRAMLESIADIFLNDPEISLTKAAQLVGTNKNTMGRMIADVTGLSCKENTTAEVAVALRDYLNTTDEVVYPEFPDDDLPVEEIIDTMSRRFEKTKESYKAHTWFPLKINIDGPVGILFVGDPHIDDNGCDWPTLKRHVELAAETRGVYAVNIGDTTNNWVGRLMRKYADQDSSIKTARRLAQWLMHDCGITWLAWLLGNHDAWNDGAEVLAQMAAKRGTKRIVTHDWEARFVLEFPNGMRFKVFAAHDFPGHSMYHPMHGPLKASRFGADDIDLFVAGHKHTWGIQQTELAEKGRTAPLLLRVRGYKFFDDYARHLGLPEQQEGQSCLVVINPDALTLTGRAMPFFDIEQGIKFLKHLREPWDAAQNKTKARAT